MKAASELRSTKALRAETYTVLFGLLACTGMRISEALRLTRSDVDLEAGVITIRSAKFQTSRLVPTHDLATPALRACAGQRDRRVTRPRSDAFFLSESGTSLKYITVHHTFDRLRHQLGWKSGRQQRAPRIHDLRHTFAVRCLIRWYEQGAEINHKIASLSTYLGHADVSSTYWYLSAVPELLALAAARFEGGCDAVVCGGSPMTTASPPPFPLLVQQYFCQRLIAQRNASQRTVSSYRDTFRLLLGFAENRLHKIPTALALSDLDAPFILEFLDHLEQGRGNTPRTRNARLTTIRSL